MRGILVALFAVAVTTQHVHIATLVLLAFASTTLQTLFDNAATALLPSIVPSGALAAANARLMTGQALAGPFVGAPVAGVIISLSLALPFAFDAVTYFVAAVLIASLPRAEPIERPAGVAMLRSEIRDGLRVLWGDRVLRAICVSDLLASAVIGSVPALLVLIVTQWAGTSDTMFALILAGYGGRVGCGRHRRRAFRTTCRGAPCHGDSLVCAGRQPGRHRIGCSSRRDRDRPGCVRSRGNGVQVQSVTLTQQRIGSHLIGRVSSASRTLSVASAPVGALLAGALAEVTDVNVPVLVSAVIMAAAAYAIYAGLAPGNR